MSFNEIPELFWVTGTFLWAAESLPLHWLLSYWTEVLHRTWRVLCFACFLLLPSKAYVPFYKGTVILSLLWTITWKQNPNNTKYKKKINEKGPRSLKMISLLGKNTTQVLFFFSIWEILTTGKRTQQRSFVIRLSISGKKNFLSFFFFKLIDSTKLVEIVH